MRKSTYQYYLILVLILMLSVCACSTTSSESTAFSDEPITQTNISLTDGDGEEEATIESREEQAIESREETAIESMEDATIENKEPSVIYQEAIEKISSGRTLDGIIMLTQIPSYADAELYLIGYSYLEYFIGDWEADLENDFQKGITTYPYEMTFTISDTGIWFDSEINGFQRLRFPVDVDYTIWKDSKTETGKESYEGYLLFETQGDNNDFNNTIIFGLEKGGLWYNFCSDSADRAKCSFVVFDDFGDADTKSNNTFYCNRTTEQQKSNITWANPSSINAENSSGSMSNNSDIYVGDNQALERALLYLEVSAFSREGLIEQLEYEGFSYSVAEAAVDNCGANWKEQAVAKAVSYLDISAFSYDGLIEQLEYEGFSSDEAIYGVDNCGADWNEQAIKKAKQYLEYLSLSRTELIEQLKFDGFTQYQAEYGANNVH